MKIINLGEKEYPGNLTKIKNPPKQIWVEGNIENLNSQSIAVIGSRHCSKYGEKWCEKFTKELLQYDLNIVSGMAIGIDSIAHNTALKYGGKTIAVLPSGLENIYPKENNILYKNIIENGGTVISEYPPNEASSSNKFLERNRLVSGLSIGTLVIEATFRSGTSVTAKLTKEQGKEVFCIPGSLDNPKSTGTNNMIKNGAKLVSCVKDIVSCYDFLHKTKDICENNNFDLCEIEAEYRDIYKVLSDKPLDFNDISKQAKMNISEVMSGLTILELDGKVERVSGNRFIRSKN